MHYSILCRQSEPASKCWSGDSLFVYPHPRPRNTMARDASGTVLGAAAATATMPACEPGVVPPTNLRVDMTGPGWVVFAWDPGEGYARVDLEYRYHEVLPGGGEATYIDSVIPGLGPGAETCRTGGHPCDPCRLRLHPHRFTSGQMKCLPR